MQLFLLVIISFFIIHCSTARGPISNDKKTETSLPALAPSEDPSRLLYGEKTAPVLVVRYVDFTSVFCTADHDAFLKMIKNNSDSLRVLIKQVPLTNLKPFAMAPSEIFEALLRIDRKMAQKFYETATEMKTEQSMHSAEDYWKLAKQLALPIQKIKEEIARGMVHYNILNDYAEFTQFRLQGVPTTIIDGEVVVGARPSVELENIIKNHLPTKR